jgi:hypothetical protein
VEKAVYVLGKNQVKPSRFVHIMVVAGAGAVGKLVLCPQAFHSADHNQSTVF